LEKMNVEISEDSDIKSKTNINCRHPS